MYVMVHLTEVDRIKLFSRHKCAKSILLALVFFIRYSIIVYVRKASGKVGLKSNGCYTRFNPTKSIHSLIFH